MISWDYNGERDGMPRGYCLAAPDQLEPVAPPSWVRYREDMGIQMAVEVARQHREDAAILDEFDVRMLARIYPVSIVKCDNVPLQCMVALQFQPPSYAWMRAVAIAAVVKDSQSSERAEAFVLSARVRGTPQLPWDLHSMRNMTSGMSTFLLDRGRAWPVDWQIFSGAALGFPLQIVLGNPSHERMIDIEIFVFGPELDRNPCLR